MSDQSKGDMGIRWYFRNPTSLTDNQPISQSFNWLEHAISPKLQWRSSDSHTAKVINHLPSQKCFRRPDLIFSLCFVFYSSTTSKQHGSSWTLKSAMKLIWYMRRYILGIMSFVMLLHTSRSSAMFRPAFVVHKNSLFSPLCLLIWQYLWLANKTEKCPHFLLLWTARYWFLQGIINHDGKFEITYVIKHYPSAIWECTFDMDRKTCMFAACD